MDMAGVDTSKFKSHNTQAASSSCLAESQLKIQDTFTSAVWSNENTFQRFFKKPYESNCSYENVILQFSSGKLRS